MTQPNVIDLCFDFEKIVGPCEWTIATDNDTHPQVERFGGPLVWKPGDRVGASIMLMSTRCRRTLSLTMPMRDFDERRDALAQRFQSDACKHVA